MKAERRETEIIAKRREKKILGKDENNSKVDVNSWEFSLLIINGLSQPLGNENGKKRGKLYSMRLEMIKVKWCTFLPFNISVSLKFHDQFTHVCDERFNPEFAQAKFTNNEEESEDLFNIELSCV